MRHHDHDPRHRLIALRCEISTSQICRRHGGALHELAMRLLRDRAFVEEIAQEVFFDLVPGGRAGPGRVGEWRGGRTVEDRGARR